METKGIAPATPATERRQRTPLAVTRERVLGIAEQMFRQSGVQAVSVDAIAQAAGIKKMTLYRCFPSKEELVMACMDQWEAAFRRIWDQAQDQYPNESARQLLAFFQSIYELVSQPGYSGNVFMHLMTDYTDLPGFLLMSSNRSFHCVNAPDTFPKEICILSSSAFCLFMI